jgi:hypothetical protein
MARKAKGINMDIGSSAAPTQRQQTARAAYWRARAQEHRDESETFRLSPEKESYHKAEAAFCDACAATVERECRSGR